MIVINPTCIHLPFFPHPHPSWPFFWPETEYQKESKIISIRIASRFKVSIRNTGIVILVYVYLRYNAVPVSHQLQVCRGKV